MIAKKLLSLALVLTFSVAVTLSMVCRYHHGIGGTDQSQSPASHTLPLCSLLSKVIGQVFVASATIALFSYNPFMRGTVGSSDECSFMLCSNILPAPHHSSRQIH
jgi:hypothetical protein